MSFRAYLLAQQQRQDAVGDLARDVRRDPALRGQRPTPARQAGAEAARSPWQRLDCPLCGTAYRLIRRPGQRCGDLARDQAQPCPGRVVPRPERPA